MQVELTLTRAEDDRYGRQYWRAVYWEVIEGEHRIVTVREVGTIHNAAQMRRLLAEGIALPPMYRVRNEGLAGKQSCWHYEAGVHDRWQVGPFPLGG